MGEGTLWISFKENYNNIFPANLSLIFQPTTEQHGDRDRYIIVWQRVYKRRVTISNYIFMCWFDC